jgi:agmatinase
MPAVGTPEPGGLSWYETLALLRKVIEAKRVVACDLVELAPIAGLHACDSTAAHLAYKMMSYALSGTRPRSGAR